MSRLTNFVVQFFAEMVDFIESDEELENFEGFNDDDLNGYESESDISISSVGTEDIADVENLFSEDETEETWSSNSHPLNVRPFASPSGPVFPLTPNQSALDIFSLIFTEDIVSHMVEQTNLYAQQRIATKPDAKWFATTVEEMKAFLGLHAFFGVKKLPESSLYWSDDPWLGVPQVKNTMPRNRFDKLNQYLHLNDNSNALPREDANYDKLFKVRPLLDAITKQFREVYNPAQNLSIDEAMIAFKGRLSIQQYMSMKPIKRGIKVWCCASSENGFVSALQVYTGKKDGVVECDLSSRVVKDLTRTFTRKNHHVFCDNSFSSVKLAADLLKDNIYLTATTRTNRKDFPKELAKTTPAIKRLKQGESKFLRKGDVVASVWMDKKPVTFLSTYSNSEGAETVKRKQRDGTVIDVPSLPVVTSYNKSMGGVDLSDQLRSYYPSNRKARKWWRYILVFFVRRGHCQRESLRVVYSKPL